MGSSDPHRYQFTGLPPAKSRQGQDWLASLLTTNKRLGTLKQTKSVYAGSFVQPGPTHRLYRGEADAKREQVVANTITAFTSLELTHDTPEQNDALHLQIGSQVTTTRSRHESSQIEFGSSNLAWELWIHQVTLVETELPPLTQQLLDYLAHQLVENDWSLKHLHRLILNSRTWQQTDEPNPESESGSMPPQDYCGGFRLADLRRKLSVIPSSQSQGRLT